MKLSRILLTLAMAAASVFGQSLTTIQDTLFKADGTRFNGTITIQWNTFDAVHLGTVIQQSRAVSVVNGNLMIQLAPNVNAAAPANVYRVLYQSDGRSQFGETWSVPVSGAPLKVAAVRTGTLVSGGGGGTGTGAQTPVQEADVVGLLNDLDQRPVKGSGFGTGRVAVVNQNGEIETAVGDTADCVRVDGTTGICGSTAPVFVDAETPGGVVDGSNDTFTLAIVPSGRSLQLFRNGLYMTPDFDYSLTASAVKFVGGNIPQPLDTLTASYRVDAASLTAGQLKNLSGASLTQAHAVQVLCSATGTTTGNTTYSSLGYCLVPVGAFHPGDRIEVRLSVEHTGTASAFDMEAMFGGTVAMLRHGGVQDSALAGHVDVSVGDSGVQLTAESFGTVLPVLGSVVSAATPTADIRIDFLARLSKSGVSDKIALRNYTLLRYPAN